MAFSWRPGRREQAPLYDQICDVETLTRAWRQVRRSNGVGVDRQTVAAFEARWAENMAELTAELRERRYHPLPLRQYLLPRPDGRTRPISLLTLRDRLVQRAVLDVVRPIFAAAASLSAYGALPGRGVGDALARAESARHSGLPWIARADIRSFFEEIDHRRVVAAFRTVTGDDVLTGLVEEWLAIGVLAPLPGHGVGETVAPLNELASDPSETEDPEADSLPDSTRRGNRLASGLETGFAVAQALGGSLRDQMLDVDVARPAIAGAAGWLASKAARVPVPGGRAGLAVGVGLALAGVAGAAVVAARSRRASEEDAGPRGTPQGSPLSPLLATAVLDPLDRALERQGRILVRYVDDLVILCPDEASARRSLILTEQTLARLGLALNSGKTLVQPYDAGFTFLGASLPQLPPEDPRSAATRALAEAFRRGGYWRSRQLARQRPEPSAEARPAPCSQPSSALRPVPVDRPPAVARPAVGDWRAGRRQARRRRRGGVA